MKLFLLSSLLYSIVFINAQTPPIQCDPGQEPVEVTPGDWRCRATTVVCPDDWSEYFASIDTLTQMRCCSPDRQLVIYDEKTRVGICCAAGTVYVGDKPNGLCCKPGEIIQDGKCAAPPPPPPPPPPSPPGPSEGCPSQPNNACRLRKACGTGTTNGLQYGSCYQITFSDGSGQQLGRGYTQDDKTTRPNVYVQRGWVSNIPYKICKSATDCGTGAVQSTDVFVIEDQIGPVNDAAGTKGWLSNAADPNLITITTAAAEAGKFKGKTSCSACKCVVALTGDTRGLTLNGVLEPEERRQSGLGYRMSFRTNANAAVTFEFAEVPCVAGPVLAKAAAGNAAQVPLVLKTLL